MDEASAKLGIEGLGRGETMLTKVRRHPFGLVVLYFQVTAGFMLSFGLIYFLLTTAFSIDGQMTDIISLVGVVVIALMLLILLLGTYIYRQNRLLVSDKNLTQVLQRGLFNHQVSELSLANVEDVTAHRNGIFATIFNFGELCVETAGEQNNFNFI